MKKFILLLLLFASQLQSGRAAVEDIPQLRLRYIKAVEDAAEADRLLTELTEKSGKDAFLLAYRGAAEALVAKHSWNPYTKMKFLRRSQETLKAAIDKSPNDAEMRFLRFSIQYYVPSWLGFSGDLEGDKKAILRNLDKTAPDVKKAIISFLKESGRCTADELRQLKANA